MTVSHRTQVLAVQLLTNKTLGEIDTLFSSHEFAAPTAPADLDRTRWACVGSSQRRELAAGYHDAVDASDPLAQVRLLRAYDELLTDEELAGFAHKEVRAVAGALSRDGILLRPEGGVARQLLETPSGGSVDTAPVQLAGNRDLVVLSRHLERLKRGEDFGDAADVVLTARELIESASHIVIEAHGDVAPKNPSLGQLYSQAAKHLGLHAAAVEGDSEASKAAKKVLQGLASVADGMGPLRTKIGRGHGSSTVGPANQRHAALARNAALTLVTFMLDTWFERQAEEGLGSEKRGLGNGSI